VLRLAQWCKEREIIFVLDESFVDFADTAELSSLLDQEVLKRHDNLVVIKSISKSFGVPGLRLGVLASTNADVLSMIGKELAIWNINSFGEFFMQIWGKYRSSYTHALTSLKEARKNLVVSLQELGWMHVMPSEANYLMCELKDGMSANDLAVHLLEDHNILIKDLSTKRGIAPRQCIRLAVRDEEDNKKLIKALKEYGN
jgi:histidinol-phosphate/aromatic aminotransferase/cobyric acid decarboxylase-like protein